MSRKINPCIIGIITACLILSACSPQPATSRVTPFPSTAPAGSQAPGIQPGAMSEIDAWLSETSEQGDFTGSVLVAQEGEVLLSKGYGLADREQNIPNTPHSRFRLGSVTKQFTAMAILILQQQGKLDVQDPICMYLDDCPEIWQPITIHHLLTHTSGIVNFTSLASYRRLMTTPVTPEQNMANFKDLLLEFPPGTRYHYSNSGYIVLGNIIERAAGMSYEAFLQQAIFTPLGMRDTGVEHADSGVVVGYARSSSKKPAEFIDMSVPFAAGNLYSTVEDMLLWDQVLYTEQLLPRSMLELMFTQHARMPEENLSYGYGWMIMQDGERTIVQHGGGINGFRSLIVRYPEEKVLIVILSNQEKTPMDELGSSIDQMLFGET